MDTPHRYITWDEFVQTGWSQFCNNLRLGSRHEDPDPECECLGVVSCWIGDFADERTFDMYLGDAIQIWEFCDDFDWWDEQQQCSPFWNDLEVGWLNLGLQRECGALVNSCSFNRQSVSQLFSNFPHVGSFLESVNYAARLIDSTVGNAAIAIYNFSYDNRGQFAFGRMRFLGAFDYSPVRGFFVG